MGLRHASVLAIAVALLAGVAAAQGAVAGDLKSLKINESRPLDITLENPLPINDVYTVTFTGDGFLLIQPDYPSTSDPNITCSGNGRICVNIGPNEEFNLTLDMAGTAIGQGLLTATVNSSTTQLSSEDEISVRVEPNFAPATVSAPGIMVPQLLVIAVFGALLVGLAGRREDFKASDSHPGA